ncbi:MAG: response regulator [Methylophagaceae bacterium]
MLNKHILYVEDNHSNRQLMRAFFKQQPHIALHLAETAEKGLTLLAELSMDLILMDINLPGIDGRTLSKRLKEEADIKHVPIVAVTAMAMPDDRQDISMFDDYITKPIDFSLLTACLQKHL